MRRQLTLVAVSGVLAAALTVGPTAAAAHDNSSQQRAATPAGDPRTVDPGVYLVVLRGQPLASYDGHLRDFTATTPVAGQRFRADTPAARAYRAKLIEDQAALVARLGAPPVLYNYTVALDGFAASLTGAQVKLAMSLPAVLSVQPSRKARLDSVAGSGAANAAAQVRASRPATRDDGHGVVIGIIDAGIWPENPSFAGVPTDRSTLRRTYPGFSGTCARGEHWHPTACNDKIVAAEFFVKGFGRDNVGVADFVSPRDSTGHGSHTAALAAGNPGVHITIDSQDFGTFSGTAPSAALAIYKACWIAPDPSKDGCTTADTVMAIDRAVGDGVDVINYSIGDDAHAVGVDDAVELAFLNAAEAGVFVAASAGDDGPAAATVAHPSPWVTAVGATVDRRYQGVLTLGDGHAITGSMVSDRRVGPAPLVSAASAATAKASAARAALCYPGSLDASVVGGAIVVCERGAIGRIAKSTAVEQAGGVAMVLVNTAPGGTDADIHAVPTVHVGVSAAPAISSYIDTAGKPTATLHPRGSTALSSPRPADFSARGPAAITGGDLLKPDLAAPGVSVVSATSPPSNVGRLWDLASGTSMAAPQIAGWAAAVKASHPHWSPAAIKSALMTTARRLAYRLSPLAVGAGEVVVARASDPGLVYDAKRSDWTRYLAGADPTTLNAPSIAIGSLVGAETVVRAVTNVGNASETYLARGRAPHGVSMSVTPSSMTLAPGETRRFAVTFNAKSAAHYDRSGGGSLTWSGSRGHRVTIPVIVSPAYVRAPVQLRTTTAAGTAAIRARAGVTGTIGLKILGPVSARPVHLSLPVGAFDSRDPAAGQAQRVRSYDVPAKTAALRFEVTPDETADLDLYVYRDGRLVASAVSARPGEVVTIARPTAGRYDVYVHAASSRNGATVPGEFTGWVLPRDGGGTVRRAVDVTGGRRFSVDVDTAGLDRAKRWFTAVVFENSSVTYLTVN